MSTILDEIVDLKRQEVEVRRKHITPAELAQRAAQLSPARDFCKALISIEPGTSVRVIAEVKQKSPSGGVFKESYDPGCIAAQYAQFGASAISCLTDMPFFGGRIDDMGRVRHAVDCPILRKDFLIDTYQIWESRYYGADAVLLIAEILPDELLLEMMMLAHELGMATLVEVHSLENLERVRPLLDQCDWKQCLLGINNRNLATLESDLQHCIRLAGTLSETNRVVGESAITTCEDLDRLAAAGIRIALVGESLLRQEDPGTALHKLLGGS
jgi:indole-3-glycerol phosphate synthase